MSQPMFMLRGCTPGCKSVVDGFGSCGFRTRRDCPRPYEEGALQASAALWDPFNASHRDALVLSRRAAEHACGTRLRPRSPTQLATGGFCVRLLPNDPPNNISIRAADGTQHSYTLPASVDHGAAIGGVVRVLHDLCKKSHRRPRRSILDLGAGLGQYGHALHALDSRQQYNAFDGAGNVESATGGFVRYAEFSLPLSLPRAHWVLSIDTGEHVPREHEMMFLRNLHAHACIGVIVSWADLPQGGTGHVNVHSPAYVQQSFEALGYDLDRRLTYLLRNQSDVGEPAHLVANFVAMRRRRRLPEPCGRDAVLRL